MISQNKGEWSELYVFLKLLAEGVLYGADSNLNKIDDLYYPLIKIIRTENEQTKHYIKGDSNISIVTESGEQLLSLPVTEFTTKAELLLKAIKEANTSSFSISVIESFMQTIKCTKVKADSKDKSDITIVLHDRQTQRDDTFGFSIKSRLGSASTLLNAGKTTNFIYEVSGINNAQIEQINNINTTAKLRDRLAKIQEFGTLTYTGMANEVFESNLQMVDTQFPVIISELLKLYYSGAGSSIKELTAKLQEINPCRLNTTLAQKFYEHKIKTFLTDIALGMTPATAWSGNFQATGGYIIVKESGEVLCYHIYNHNEFQEYLFKNTKFDTPSSSRHDFGSIYSNNGKTLFNLNIQIRFI